MNSFVHISLNSIARSRRDINNIPLTQFTNRPNQGDNYQTQFRPIADHVHTVNTERGLTASSVCGSSQLTERPTTGKGWLPFVPPPRCPLTTVLIGFLLRAKLNTTINNLMILCLLISKINCTTQRYVKIINILFFIK